MRYLTFDWEKYGKTYFVNSNLSENLQRDQRIVTEFDFICWMRYKQSDCFSYSLFPVKERSSERVKNYITIYLNNFFFKSEHKENFSWIELFFNAMSLCYLWTGLSFNYVLRKLNRLIKGSAFRLVYSFGLVLLQLFMIWQVQGILTIYHHNSRMPSIFTITGVELIPPAISICFRAGTKILIFLSVLLLTN